MVFFDNSAKILSLILKNLFFFHQKYQNIFLENLFSLFTIKKQGTFGKTSKEENIDNKYIQVILKGI